MRNILYLFFFTTLTFPSFADKIVTIRMSYIIKNSSEFNSIINEIENIKKNYFEELKNEEIILEKRKNEIEGSKSILNNEEFNKLVQAFNNDTALYQKKIDEYEKYLNYNIDQNKDILLNKISQLVGKFAEENKVDLVINEDQYYIASSKLDISEIILNQLNDEILNLKIFEK